MKSSAQQIVGQVDCSVGDNCLEETRSLGGQPESVELSHRDRAKRATHFEPFWLNRFTRNFIGVFTR